MKLAQVLCVTAGVIALLVAQKRARRVELAQRLGLHCNGRRVFVDLSDARLLEA